MSLRIEKEHYGRLILVSVATLMWLFILVSYQVRGYGPTWGIWHIPSWRLPFLDFRLIPGSAESFAHGYEPTVENPYDPTQRIFNYPAFWRLFFYTGITQDDSIWIGISMIVLFFIGVFLFPEKLSVPGAIGMLLVTFSPAAVLLYERGNVDLIVFFLCALIVLAGSRSANLAAILITFGAIVKMFPFFGITILLKETKKKFWILFLVCLTAFLVYMAATWSSVKAAWNTTMRGNGLSYGTNVFVTRYEAAIEKVVQQWFTPHQTDLVLKYGPLLVGLALLLGVAILAFVNREPFETSSERNFAAFRMGASIYVGTFLLGNNFDYRLAFLIFMMPQLVAWMGSTSRNYRVMAWISTVLVLLSSWHMWIIQIPLESIMGSVEDSQKFWIIVDEAFNWMLFANLAYLLIASTPDWLKDPVRILLPKRIAALSAHP
jgi:hypothetical protein